MYFDTNTQPGSDARVQIGIDAAVVAHHHVCARSFAADGQVNVSPFQVPPTLTGLATLTKRLSSYPGVLATATGGRDHHLCTARVERDAAGPTFGYLSFAAGVRPRLWPWDSIARISPARPVVSA